MVITCCTEYIIEAFETWEIVNDTCVFVVIYRFVRATMSFSDIKEMQREPPPKAHNYYWYGNKVGFISKCIAAIRMSHLK
jgi:hypothetical protein